MLVAAVSGRTDKLVPVMNLAVWDFGVVGRFDRKPEIDRAETNSRLGINSC
jgi:hypothetical protein